LVTTGYAGSIELESNRGKEVDVFDVYDALIECQAPKNMSQLVIEATGGLIDDKPLICGGKNAVTNQISKECMQPGNLSINMTLGNQQPPPTFEILENKI